MLYNKVTKVAKGEEKNMEPIITSKDFFREEGARSFPKQYCTALYNVKQDEWGLDAIAIGWHFVEAVMDHPELMVFVQEVILENMKAKHQQEAIAKKKAEEHKKQAIVTKEKEEKTVEKETKKKAVSPAWQAKLDGKIDTATYNKIISHKMTLEEALKVTKKAEPKKVEPKKAEPKVTKEKKVEKPKTRAEGIALFYAKQMGIKVEGRRLITEDDWSELLDEVVTKKGKSARKLEGMIYRKINKMIDEKEAKANLS